MFDIRAIRGNPQEFDAGLARRGLEPQSPRILSLDEQRRSVQTGLQTLQSARNEKSKQIGDVKKAGGDASAVMAEVAAMKDRMAALELEEKALAVQLHTALSSLPNMLDSDVPDGKDETQNREVRQWGTPKEAKTPEHFDIGEKLGQMDFETAAKMSGSRFVLLSGALARMERALAQFMLDTHTGEHGYTEVSPPLLVRDNTMYGTGQLPKFADDLFKVPHEETVLVDGFEVKIEEGGPMGGFKVTPLKEGDTALEELLAAADEISVVNGLSGPRRAIVRKRRWLIPTAEVSLTNMVAESILDEESFPRRYTAFTPCFRSEAGSAGKDTRGMIRMHQFYKVELVSITAPEDSVQEHERMTECAETILKKLELPFRTLLLCSGDTGFGSRKTYDLEVWLPGQNQYREISSCSNCGDFQARRMNARMRAKGEKDTKFLHTLNGSGTAVGRALIAVMENYYDPADGGVFVPDVLKPYMGGLTKIALGEGRKTAAA
jgi:seryl-tRNA synthetase